MSRDERLLIDRLLALVAVSEPQPAIEVIEELMHEFAIRGIYVSPCDLKSRITTLFEQGDLDVYFHGNLLDRSQSMETKYWTDLSISMHRSIR